MKVSVSLPDELIVEIDRARGLVTRSRWLADAARVGLGQAPPVDTPNPGPATNEPGESEAADRASARPGAASPQGASGPAAPTRTEQFRQATQRG